MGQAPVTLLFYTQLDDLNMNINTDDVFLLFCFPLQIVVSKPTWDTQTWHHV